MLKKEVSLVPTNIGKNSNLISDDGNFILDLNSLPTYTKTSLDENNIKGIFNTQEISLDWSKFENHTFFNSAKVKVDTAFNKIINEYPFDANEEKIIDFIKNLTGFEKWVFDSFPRSTGSLHFKNDGVNGVYLRIQEPAGSIFSDLSNRDDVKKIINFYNSFSIQFNVFLPEISNTKQIIFQKQNISGSNSIGVVSYLSSSVDTTKTNIIFSINSGSLQSSVECEIEKGKFNNISFICDFSKNKLFLYQNGELINQSYQLNKFNSIYSTSSFLIGSGTQWKTDTDNINFDLFSGSLDEFKIWNKVIESDKIINYNKPIFSQEDLLVYYKFNEPAIQIASPTSPKNAIVLDYSGNSLHTYVENLSYFYSNLTSIRSFQHESNTIDEKYYYYTPVLFIKHPNILNFKTELEEVADEYDVANPNLITKLVPKHFLIEDIFTILKDDGTEETVTNNSVLLTFLYSYAKLFDEMKIFLDSFSRVRKIGYDENENLPDKFISNLFNFFGFEQPSVFENYSISDHYENNILLKFLEVQDFNKIKNLILKRVLTSLPELIKVKGTINSIEMFMRTIGLEPNYQFKIKEYGGSKINKINLLRDKKTINLNKFKLVTYQNITSPYLRGNYYNFDAQTDFYTANSWSYECLYKLNDSYEEQSLIRFYINDSTKSYLVSNIIADKDKVTLYLNADELDQNELVLTLNVNVFDGNIFHLSFGKNVENKSYYFSINKQLEGEIYESHYVEEQFIETQTNTNSVFYKEQTYNTNGVFFEIGDKDSEQFESLFLNKDANKRICRFSGEVSQIRFWTKLLSKEEIKEHSLNYENIGTLNASNTLTFNNSKKEGVVNLNDFERLLINVTCNQDDKLPDNLNQISLFDYSGNEFNLNAINIIENNFTAYKQKISCLVSNVDSINSQEKVRVRSYSNYENLNSISRIAPVYNLQKNELFEDSSILSIEYSLVELLNSDIMNIFSSMQELENHIGNIENLYSYEYKNLHSLREIYFLKLNDKINFKSFYETFKWFDKTIENFINQIIPRKTKFLGVNFIIEQHQLERSKFEHKNNGQYTGITDYSNKLGNY